MLPHARLVAAYERAEETSSCHARLLSALASYDTIRGDIDTAHTAAVEAIAIYRITGEYRSLDFMGSGFVLVNILLKRGKLQETEALSCELLSIGTEIGRMSYKIASLHALSICSQKRYSEGERLLRQLLDRATSLNDCDVGERSLMYRDLARVLAENKKYFEAEEILSQGMDLVEDSLNRNSLKNAMGDVCAKNLSIFFS